MNTSSRPAASTKSKKKKTKTVLIAGASGYLGRFLVQEYAKHSDDWHVKAVVRLASQGEALLQERGNVEIVVAQVTQPETLRGIMLQQDGHETAPVDLVVSALGITRQRKEGPTYQQVDYQANMNLLEAAIQAGVPRFGYIHVLGADRMVHLPPIRAKQDFVDALLEKEAQGQMAATVICPSGFFSDMGDFLEMAQQGRVWLFGSEASPLRLNPIHGADLARATFQAIDEGRGWVEVGGPDTFTHTELAQLAFSCLNDSNQKQDKDTQPREIPVRITYLWDGWRRWLLHVLPWITPAHIHEPASFFLTAMGLDMVAEESYGDHHLKDFFLEKL